MVKKIKQAALLCIVAILVIGCGTTQETAYSKSPNKKQIANAPTEVQESISSRKGEQKNGDEDGVTQSEGKEGNGENDEETSASSIANATKENSKGDEGVSGEETTPSTNKEEANTKPPASQEQPSSSQPNSANYVTISIDAKTLLANMDKVKENKKAYVPSDGWVLAPTKVEIKDGETVFDVLRRVTRDRRIHMEYQGGNSNIYNSAYVQGIAQLYEFDGGELSGWMYTVNGQYIPQGSSAVEAKNGMVIAWRYTCDLGRDLGFSI